MGDFRSLKVAKSGGRYFYELNTPGWPSLVCDQYHLSELNRIVPFQEKPHALKVLLLAITKKCALQCEHCFEWDALNGKEKLTTDNLKTIVQKFQANGVGQVQFSGGEPLLRMPAILEVVGAAAPGTDFWVITLGHRLTPKMPTHLRVQGLRASPSALITLSRTCTTNSGALKVPMIGWSRQRQMPAGPGSLSACRFAPPELLPPKKT
ncbi:hypothetical protein GCM10027443_07480 [Pontibacter brevis]